VGKNYPTPFVIPSESLFLLLGLNQGEIPRFVRNDKIIQLFRSLFSLCFLSIVNEFKTRRLKSLRENSI
jgi:hypothetical protein